MFNTLINRSKSVAEWHKIPWHDPDFSRRMLNEHLRQDHDRASRRQHVIDDQVEWIHHKILNNQPAKILDLGCGPGFYAGRLSALGHRVTGIDFSPASLDYAREHYPAATYKEGNMLDIDFGEDYDLIMLVHGELNGFAPTDGERLIQKIHAALKNGGKMLLEVSTYASIYDIGHAPKSWHTAEKGLFGDEPYLCLIEAHFEVDCAISYYNVFLSNTDETVEYITMHHAYTDDDYRRLLEDFNHVQFYPSMDGSAEIGGVFAILAEK